MREIYDLNIIKFDGVVFTFHEDFMIILKNKFFENFLFDSVEYSINNFNKDYNSNEWVDGFHLYRKYSRKDVFRILNFQENPVAQNVGGYLVSHDNKNCPIFVNYHKDDDISESTKYEDKFVNHNEFDWMSKSNRKIQSKDVQSILGNKGVIRLPLFIKKNNDEGTDFYFMGNINPQLNKVEQSLINSDSGRKVSVVKIRFDLENQVIDSIYNYLHENIGIKENVSIVNKMISIDNEQLDVDFPERIVESIHTIPLFDFYAAAGTFSEMQDEKDYKPIPVPEKYATDQHFACRIKGESMNRIIPNGAICIFKKNVTGSRNGKVILFENRDFYDPDFNSAFTVKTYSSEKIISEEGWEHSAVVLKPNSYDKRFKNIVLNEENSSEIRVVGELVFVLEI